MEHSAPPIVSYWGTIRLYEFRLLLGKARENAPTAGTERAIYSHRWQPRRNSIHSPSGWSLWSNRASELQKYDVNINVTRRQTGIQGNQVVKFGKIHYWDRGSWSEKSDFLMFLRFSSQVPTPSKITHTISETKLSAPKKGGFPPKRPKSAHIFTFGPFYVIFGSVWPSTRVPQQIFVSKVLYLGHKKSWCDWRVIKGGLYPQIPQKLSFFPFFRSFYIVLDRFRPSKWAWYQLFCVNNPLSRWSKVTMKIWKNKLPPFCRCPPF